MPEVENRNSTAGKRARIDGWRREDDWKCPSCRNLNFSFRTTCNRRNCGQSRPAHHNLRSIYAPPYNSLLDRHLAPPPHYGYSGVHHQMFAWGARQGLYLDEYSCSKDWMCPTCGNVNFSFRTVCNRRECSTPRPENPGPKPNTYKGSKQQKMREGSWKCEKCDNINYPFRTKCNRQNCGAQKPSHDSSNPNPYQVNYIMICPDVSEKLKCEEPPKDTNDMDCSDKPVEEVPPQQIVEKEIIYNDNCVQNKKNKFVLLCSALSQHEKGLVEEFVKKNGATIIEEWRNDATHIITSENATCSCRRIRRVYEVLMAILHGQWVVTIEWIEACLENGAVLEESYEVNEDFYGDFEGPRKGRIRASQKAPNIFARLGFSLSTYLPENKKKLMEELVTAGGGKITNKDDNFSLMYSSAKSHVLTNYLVYDVSLKCSSEINKEFLKFGEKNKCSRLVCYNRVLNAVGAFDSELLNKAQDSEVL